MRIIILCVALATLSIPSTTYSHPGRTAADGCHYCRTNCDKWGVEWDKRHCHGNKQEDLIHDQLHSQNSEANSHSENLNEIVGPQYKVHPKQTTTIDTTGD